MNTASSAITVTMKYSELEKASIALAEQLTAKKFPHTKRNAYLSCFLNIGTVVDFLNAVQNLKSGRVK